MPAPETHNQVLVLLFIIFLFHMQYLCGCVHFHQIQLQVYSHENINQYTILRLHVFCFKLMSAIFKRKVF